MQLGFQLTSRKEVMDCFLMVTPAVIFSATSFCESDIVEIFYIWVGSTATKIDPRCPEGIVRVGWAGLNSRENGRRSTEVTELWILGDLIKSLILPVKPRCFVLSSSVCFRLASVLQISFSAHNGVSQGLPRTWIGNKMAILQLLAVKIPFPGMH